VDAMAAPGFGPIGFGVAMLAVGGLLVGNRHELAGVLLVQGCADTCHTWSALLYLRGLSRYRFPQLRGSCWRYKGRVCLSLKASGT
jgi:hypothetical protein